MSGQDSSKAAADALFNYVRDVIYEPSKASLNVEQLPTEFADLGKGLQYLAAMISEGRTFVRELSEGNLNCPLPDKDNEIASDFKKLHASLKHLTWQTQQVAKGDFNQRVDFMGDFSDAFNEMTRQLELRTNNLQKIIDEKTKSVVELKNAVLKTMAELVEYRDDVIGGHIERTQDYLGVLINAMLKNGLYTKEMSSWGDINMVLQSAQLHDIGKIAIKDSILQKPGKLTTEEFEEIKKHTVVGEKIIEEIEQNSSDHEFLEHARIFAVTHHEYWDGRGYPRGLKGMEIPLQGRLMAIADVYDALVSTRPYKKAFTHQEAVDIIVSGKGTHFDPALVELFLGVSEEFKKVANSATLISR
jgi:response regulator RpfG family c-di-GMP phosphodiesterase